MRGTLAKRQRRAGVRIRRKLPAYLDVRAYLLSRGYVRSRRQAAEALEAGKVSINGATYSYPHFPKDQLDYDSCGRPRIMVEGVPDPRPCS
jgi:hypothetical protein